MEELFNSGISLAVFYRSLPALLASIESKMTAFVSGEVPTERESKTVRILVIAEPSCVDSVVNLKALLEIERVHSLEIKVVTVDSYNQIYSRPVSTPTIIGLDQNYSELWRWTRVPRNIKSVEESGDQVKIIVEKRRYRQGLYINNTFHEIEEML